MANLVIIDERNIVRTTPAVNGEEITIKAPCDCSAVTGVQIGEDVYPFYDAAGKPMKMGTGLFAEGSLIRVLIDTENNRAMILNHAVTPESIGLSGGSGWTVIESHLSKEFGEYLFGGSNVTKNIEQITIPDSGLLEFELVVFGAHTLNESAGYLRLLNSKGQEQCVMIVPSSNSNKTAVLTAKCYISGSSNIYIRMIEPSSAVSFVSCDRATTNDIVQFNWTVLDGTGVASNGF